jgi:periplasmic divalent cation tolerance protein
MGRELVSRRLAACAHVFLRGQSTYWWQGKIETVGESQLLLKSHPDILPKLISAIEELHPYHVPELLVLQTSHASDAYAKWVQECCS